MPCNQSESSKDGPVARACARSASARVPPEEDSDIEDVSDAELEAVAVAIETGKPMSNESIRDIILRYPEIRRRVVANAVRSLGARRWWYDAKRKRRIDEPDYQLRFRALEFLADRVDGRPAQSILNLNLSANADGKEQRLTEDMIVTPASVEAMQRMVDRARKNLAVRNPGPKQATPVPAETGVKTPR